MRNVNYTVTDYKRLVVKGVVNSQGTGITITKDNGTTTTITPAQCFVDFPEETIQVTIAAENEDDSASADIYDEINGVS